MIPLSFERKRGGVQEPMPAVIGLLKSAAKFSKVVVERKSASKSERNLFGRATSTVQSFAGDIGWLMFLPHCRLAILWDPGCHGPRGSLQNPPLASWGWRERASSVPARPQRLVDLGSPASPLSPELISSKPSVKQNETQSHSKPML